VVFIPAPDMDVIFLSSHTMDVCCIFIAVYLCIDVPLYLPDGGVVVLA